MKVDVALVNAFTANMKGGNAAGVVLNAESLSDEQMQSIAAQVGASETAFVLPDEEATHKLRFFTPTVEVPLCGHATIATWWLLHNIGLQNAGGYTQKTLDGTINISLNKDNRVFMEQPPQELKGYVEPRLAAKALGITEDSLREDLKPQIIQHQLMVGLKSKELLNQLQPDLATVEQVSKDFDFFGFHVYVLLDDSESVATVRNFCPRVGIDEDAATGTGNGSFLAYLHHYNMLPPKNVFRIEQGEAMGKLSYLFGKFHGDRVWIGGSAIQASEMTVEV